MWENGTSFVVELSRKWIKNKYLYEHFTALPQFKADTNEFELQNQIKVRFSLRLRFEHLIQTHWGTLCWVQSELEIETRTVRDRMWGQCVRVWQGQAQASLSPCCLDLWPVTWCWAMVTSVTPVPVVQSEDQLAVPAVHQHNNKL